MKNHYSLLKSILAAAIPMYSVSAQGEALPLVDINIAGKPEVVYDWSSSPCGRSAYPDTAARAIRQWDGRISLFAPSNRNWYLEGLDPSNLRPKCTPAFMGKEDTNPASFDDQGWIEALYTEDGKKVFAFLSNDFTPWRHSDSKHFAPEMCPDRSNEGCTYYAVTMISSEFGVNAFASRTPSAVVAALPKRFKPYMNGRTSYGAATISNIVSKDGYQYALVGMRSDLTSETGSCLIRTNNLGDHSSWRGWDGIGFTVKFQNPYLHLESQSARTCSPVISGEARSLVYLQKSRVYVAVFRQLGSDRAGKLVPGIFYSTSPDLLHWSDLRLIAEIPYIKDCTTMIYYPSIIDFTDKSLNFENVENDPYLYYIRFNRSSCASTLDRDLVRVKVAIEPLSLIVSTSPKRLH